MDPLELILDPVVMEDAVNEKRERSSSISPPVPSFSLTFSRNFKRTSKLSPVYRNHRQPGEPFYILPCPVFITLLLHSPRPFIRGILVFGLFTDLLGVLEARDGARASLKASVEGTRTTKLLLKVILTPRHLSSSSCPHSEC